MDRRGTLCNGYGLELAEDPISVLSREFNSSLRTYLWDLGLGFDTTTVVEPISTTRGVVFYPNGDVYQVSLVLEDDGAIEGRT